MMGTPLEHSNFSRNSLFPLRSAPLRSAPCLNHWYISPERTGNTERFMPTSNKLLAMCPSVCRSAPPRCSCLFQFVPVNRDHIVQCNDGIKFSTCLFQDISQFQRSGAEQFWQWWEHHLNIAISLGIHYFSAAPLRSVPQSLPSSNGAERNNFDNDGNTTWTLQFL